MWNDCDTVVSHYSWSWKFMRGTTLGFIWGTGMQAPKTVTGRLKGRDQEQMAIGPCEYPPLSFPILVWVPRISFCNLSNASLIIHLTKNLFVYLIFWGMHDSKHTANILSLGSKQSLSHKALAGMGTICRLSIWKSWYVLNNCGTLLLRVSISSFVK